MADQELSALTEDTAPAVDDWVYKVNAAGTVDRKVSYANLLFPSLPKAGGTSTGLTTFQAGVKVTDDDGSTSVNGYRSLIDLRPPTSDEEVVGLLLKVPDSTFGVGQDYTEGNMLVLLSDADNTVTTPATILKVISATTNATPVAVTTSTTHGFSTNDVVRITGTGIGALDSKWWKVTVTSTTAFTLNESTAPGSTAAVGYAFTDRSAVLARIDQNGGIGTNGVHVAAGLRGQSLTGLAAQGLWVDPSHDCVGIVIHNASTAEWTPALTSDYVNIIDTRSANAKRFAVNAAGQTVHDFGTAALPGVSFVGQTDSGMYATAGALGFSVGGVLRGYFTATQFSFIVPAVFAAGANTMGEGGNLAVGTTTGTKLGTAITQKLAFHNSTPVIQRAGAAQAAVATTGSALSSYGYTTAAQADAIVTLVNEMRAALVEKGLIKGAA